tara:strand:- start:388 stop:1848 length:1461 start_codon:yes stop_codon:yes gene_type:complete
MPRNRVIYQSEALFVGPSPATGIHFHNYSGLTGEAGTWANAIHTLDAKFGNQLSASGETALLTIFTGASGSNAVGDVYRFGPDGGISAIGAGKTQTLTFTGANRIEQLHRIQSCNYSFNIARTDVNQFGELAAIDRVVLESPTVALDFSYVLANFANESKLGFDIVQANQGKLFKGGLGISCLSGILTKKEDERNYFIKTVDEGYDAKNHEATRLGGTPVKGYGDSVIALGNGFMTSYTSEASVGAMPTVSINVEALNMCFEYGSTAKKTPAINPSDGTRRSEVYSLPTAGSNPGTGNLTISVLRPGDITFSFKKREATLTEGLESTPTLDYDVPGPDLDDVKIQSYSIGFDIAREPIQKLGSRFAFSREITFPVTVTCTIDALVGDLNSGNLSDMINCDDAYDIKINLKNPAGCAVDSTQTVCEYNLRQAKVNSQSYTSDIGSNKSVTLEFAAQIGGPNQNYVGLFMSGVATNPFATVHKDPDMV